MDKHALKLFSRVFNEIKYSFSAVIFLVENELVFYILPLKREVYNPFSFKVVHNLLTWAIDNMSYFIRDYKFLVL